jgi:hypothetical protein
MNSDRRPTRGEARRILPFGKAWQLTRESMLLRVFFLWRMYAAPYPAEDLP